MNYQKINARLGDTLKISDSLSLKFMKFAEDLPPTWFEIPAESPTIEAHEGDYVAVTQELYFVLEKGKWRIMTHEEQLRLH